MAAEMVGKVESRSGRYYEVWWDSSSRDVYVRYTGTLMPMSGGAKRLVGRAKSLQEALDLAQGEVAGE